MHLKHHLEDMMDHDSGDVEVESDNSLEVEKAKESDGDETLEILSDEEDVEENKIDEKKENEEIKENEVNIRNEAKENSKIEEMKGNEENEINNNNKNGASGGNRLTDTEGENETIGDLLNGWRKKRKNAGKRDENISYSESEIEKGSVCGKRERITYSESQDAEKSMSFIVEKNYECNYGEFMRKKRRLY